MSIRFEDNAADQKICGNISGIFRKNAAIENLQRNNAGH
jgi:hypothetical protein